MASGKAKKNKILYVVYRADKLYHDVSLVTDKERKARYWMKKWNELHPDRRYHINGKILNKM